MSIKKLGNEVQSRLSAAAKINSYKRAVEELVYNSLDSDSTSIAIRIDIHENFVQVIDNGSGISKSDNHLLGQRYATSKTAYGSVLKGNSTIYGFRGESLANIIEVTSHVKITSRYENSDETWIKLFDKGQHRDTYKTTMRPSKGTTVEIKGFLYNLHIQQKETNNVTEILSIKKFLQQVSLEKTNISMSFRDNSRNEIVFTAHKNRDIYQTLYTLFEINKNDIQELQVEKNEYKIKGFVGKNNASHNSYKWICLNGRFVHKSSIHDILNEFFMKSQAQHRKISMKKYSQDGEITSREIPCYFLFITCPQSDYDISFNPEKTFIQFRYWNQIKLLIEKFVQFFNGNIKLKEVSVQKSKGKKLAGSTQEEARKIVEKILGNKNKIQMNKGVTGKIIRKKIKRKSDNDNIQKKNCHEENNKKLRCKESSIAEPLNLQYSIKHDNVDNKRIDSVNKLPQTKRVPEKIKRIKRNRSSPYTDPLIKKFIEATDSVKHRCDLYSKNIKELLNKKLNPIREQIRHTTIEEDVTQNKNEKYSIIQSKDTVRNHKSNEISNVVSLAKANKGYLRSCDLIKTILNSQKDPSCMENGVVIPRSTNKRCVYIDNSYNYNNIIDVTPSKSNATLPSTKLTFDSHRYVNHNTFKSKINRRRKSTTNLYEYSVRKEITQSVYKTKFKHKVLKEDLLKNNYEQHKKQNVDKSLYSKLDSILSIAEQKSYNIDISYNRNSDFMETLNKYSYDRWNFKVTENIQSTYTVIDSNVSINIENFNNHQNTRSDSYEKSIAVEKEKNFSTLSTLSRKEAITCHNKELYSRKINNGCNSKSLFPSYSESIESEMTSSNFIEPLTVCEAVYENQYDGTTPVDSTYISNNANSRSILEITNNFKGDCTLRNDMDEKSHHFQNAKDSLNVPNIVQSQVINKNQITDGEERELNSKAEEPNEKYTIDSLDFYFETNLDWTNIVSQNQDNNKFKMQDRHNFLPKGMSQIFANGNTKKVCSYDLNVEYFRDDMYNEFANNVLDNFNLFETRIQNVKDNAPRTITNLNKKLKTDNTSLKFNTNSLKNAIVFGQVDNKYIAAQLQSDIETSLKYLVLFDQHAVHERITLEENLSDYINDDQWISEECEILAIKLNKEKIIYLTNYKEKFMQLGLKWMFENDLVLFNGIPKAILGKHSRQPNVILTCVKNLITEEIKAIKSLKGNTLLYPKSIMDLIFSEACRYAIKFGDVLTKDKCATLIQSLSTCKTPFQCAHGRPVMAVLLDINTIDDKYTVNMSNVLMFRNKMTK